MDYTYILMDGGGKTFVVNLSLPVCEIDKLTPIFAGK
jgi:hypothetical protein